MTELFYEILIGVGIPATAGAIGVIKYFAKKERCFQEMKRKINELASHDESSTVEHDGFHERLDIFETKQTKNEIYLKLLLDKFNIPYNP